MCPYNIIVYIQRKRLTQQYSELVFTVEFLMLCSLGEEVTELECSAEGELMKILKLLRQFGTHH